MKNLRKRASLHFAALALAGLPFVAAPNLAAAQDAAISPTNFNPPPCDFSDTFYEDNGVIPSQVVGRFGTARRTGPPAIPGHPVNWVADGHCSDHDPDRRNFRILATTGGFIDDGTGAANQFISILGFLTSQNAFETAY